VETFTKVMGIVWERMEKNENKMEIQRLFTISHADRDEHIIIC